jgi:hypothetical protein
MCQREFTAIPMSLAVTYVSVFSSIQFIRISRAQRVTQTQQGFICLFLVFLHRMELQTADENEE